MSSSIPALRLGVVPYLNVQPLIYGLAGDHPQLRLAPAPPSRLVAMLERGEIDLATQIEQRERGEPPSRQDMRRRPEQLIDVGRIIADLDPEGEIAQQRRAACLEENGNRVEAAEQNEKNNEQEPPPRPNQPRPRRRRRLQPAEPTIWTPCWLSWAMPYRWGGTVCQERPSILMGTIVMIQIVDLWRSVILKSIG